MWSGIILVVSVEVLSDKTNICIAGMPVKQISLHNALGFNKSTEGFSRTKTLTFHEQGGILPAESLQTLTAILTPA